MILRWVRLASIMRFSIVWRNLKVGHFTLFHRGCHDDTAQRRCQGAFCYTAPMQNPASDSHIFLRNADLQWQESGAPFSAQFQDIYFSRQGGVAETEHVFLAPNRLRERWASLEEQLRVGTCGARGHFTVAELGFGTGLNFLCCWRAWQEAAPRHLRMHYIACEKYPLQFAALQRALAQWPALQDLAAQLLAQYPDHTAGIHRLVFRDASAGADLTLDLYYGDAAETLAAHADVSGGLVDAWFLDGFAPRTNPELWSPALFSQVQRLSRPGATLSTYSVAGQVVRTLQESGFAVEKHPGFGHKREMLRGSLRESQESTRKSEHRGRWLQLPHGASTPAHVLVIGAGLAGCSTAWSLAQRGCRVSVLERDAEIAAGASGNRQGVLQCRLNNAVDGAWQFNLQAFLFASRHYDALQALYPSIHWQRSGVLNLDTAFSSRRERCPDVRLDLYAPAVVHRVDQAHASALAGTALDGGGNFIPLGGWLRPAALCAAWLQNPLISLQCGKEVSALLRHTDKWQALGPQGEVLAEADCVVIANGTAAASLAQTSHLPLIPLRGQLSHLRASAQSSTLKAVVCGRSYIIPSLHGEHCAGASYSKDVSDLSLSMREQSENLAGIMPHLQEAALDDAALNGGRVAVRAGSPDRTPMAGPAVDAEALETLYRALPQHERKHPTVPLPCHAGLYINVGHGSHGVGNTPLLAEYLASLMCQEPLPLQTSALEALHPARFILRRLRREPVRD